MYPNLAAQWHPTKNGALTPETVTCGSNKKVCWLMPYDDPITGKHYDFEWQAIIQDRVKGAGCPFLTGNAVWLGFNDLATKYPDVAAEWHPTLNGNLLPTDVTHGSKKEVWWLLPYNDPKTGKHFDFVWKASPNARTSGNGCPFLTGQRVWPGYNDLESNYPEVAGQWHPIRNGKMLPSEISYASNKKVWWIQPYDDPILGHFEFEWEANVLNRTLLGEKCPFLGNDKVWSGYNDLQTRFPEIAAEWHPTRNGALTPEDVVYGSPKVVWWLKPYDDPDTGKHFDFEWQAPINIRTGVGTNDGHQTGCPYLALNPKVWPGFNDLATKYPELAKEWHPVKNGDLNPSSVTACSAQKVWWLLPYDDPDTGKHFDFEWEASIISRSDGSGCPFISGHATWFGYNDLETNYPDIASQWHPIRNRRKLPEKTYQYSTLKAWWKCNHCGHEWYASVRSRTLDEVGCPGCRKPMSYYL